MWSAPLHAGRIGPNTPAAVVLVLAREDHALHRFDHGYTRLVNPYNQLDASLGVGLSASGPDFFVGVGFARRF